MLLARSRSGRSGYVDGKPPKTDFGEFTYVDRMVGTSWLSTPDPSDSGSMLSYGSATLVSDLTTTSLALDKLIASEENVTVVNLDSYNWQITPASNVVIANSVPVTADNPISMGLDESSGVVGSVSNQWLVSAESVAMVTDNTYTDGLFDNYSGSVCDNHVTGFVLIGDDYVPVAPTGSFNVVIASGSIASVDIGRNCMDTSMAVVSSSVAVEPVPVVCFGTVSDLVFVKDTPDTNSYITSGGLGLCMDTVTSQQLLDNTSWTTEYTAIVRLASETLQSSVVQTAVVDVRGSSIILN